MRILVVGAGIAGLAAGRALTRAGHAVEVVERAAGPDRGGAGIYLPGNAVRALRGVGLDELDAQPIRAQRILDHRGRLLAEIDLPSFWAPCGPGVALLREDLHRALAAGVRVGYGLEPVWLEPGPDAAGVRLSDGSWREVDLVVGADGIRSTVRRLLGDRRPPRARDRAEHGAGRGDGGGGRARAGRGADHARLGRRCAERVHRPSATADGLGAGPGAPPGPHPRATRTDPGRRPAAGRRAALPGGLPPAARRT